jgi:hypothetical protein
MLPTRPGIQRKVHCTTVGTGTGEEEKYYLRVMIAPANPLPPSNLTPFPPAER